MKQKKPWSMTKPYTKKIKTKSGQTRFVHVRGFTSILSRTPKRK